MNEHGENVVVSVCAISIAFCASKSLARNIFKLTKKNKHANREKQQFNPKCN